MYHNRPTKQLGGNFRHQLQQTNGRISSMYSGYLLDTNTNVHAYSTRTTWQLFTKTIEHTNESDTGMKQNQTHEQNSFKRIPDQRDSVKWSEPEQQALYGCGSRVGAKKDLYRPKAHTVVDARHYPSPQVEKPSSQKQRKERTMLPKARIGYTKWSCDLKLLYKRNKIWC